MVAALIAGICWTPYTLLSCLALLVSLCVLHKEESFIFLCSIILCFFFFGITRYYQNREVYFSDTNLLNKNCNITATVKEILPRLDDQEQICILLQISSIQTKDTEKHCNKSIYLFLPFYSKLWIKPYQKIIIKNIILKHPQSNSYQEYLIRANIWATAHQKRLSYTTISKPTLLRQQITILCELPLKITDRAVSELTHTLYLSIFCGKKIKSETTTKMKRLFQYWGISHHLARSGLHLILLIGLLTLLFSCIPFSARRKQIIIVGMLFVYYSITYSSIAFVRAFGMYLLYFTCKQMSLPSKPIHILLTTALFILIINPHHLFFLDFQLSFIATLLILWFCSSTQKS